MILSPMLVWYAETTGGESKKGKVKWDNVLLWLYYIQILSFLLLLKNNNLLFTPIMVNKKTTISGPVLQWSIWIKAYPICFILS